jgi:hypothetical protein
MLFTIWHLLRTRAIDQDSGADHFERRRDPAAETKPLAGWSKALGFEVSLDQYAA